MTAAKDQGPTSLARDVERMREALLAMRDRDDRNSSLPVWYREQIDAALMPVAERSAARSEHISPERRRGLEEAAKVCDEFYNEGNSPWDRGFVFACKSLAAHFRALIPPSSEGGSPR
jgi:hypothetical protein